jgi:hypothetical protein
MARTITITFEDGTTHVYQNAPDDLTPDAVQQRAQQDFGKNVIGIDGGKKGVAPAGEGMPAARAQAMPAAKTPADYNPFATAANFFPSLYQNTVGGLVNLVSSPVQSAQALGDVVAGGVYNAMPEPVQKGLTAIEQSKYNPLGNPQALKRAQDVAGALGQDYATTWGTQAGFQKMMEEDPFRLVGDVSTVLGGSGAALRAGNIGARSNAVANALTKTGNVINPMNMLAKPAAAVISPMVAPGVKALMAEGITPTTGQILGGGFKRAEEGLSSVPILGDFIKGAQTRAVEGLNRAAINRALTPIGDALPADLKGRDAVTYASDKLDNAYGTLLPKMTVLQDAPFQNEISNLKSMVDNGAIHQASKDFFSKWLDNNVLSKFQGQGAVTGDTLKGIQTNLRTTIEELSKSINFDEQKIGTALKETQDQLRQLVIRNNPQFAKELKAIDTGYANFKRVEKAAGLVGSEEGVFSPSQLQSAVRATDRSKDKGQFATGNALMQDLSETGKTVLGNKLPDSGTPYRGMLPLLLGGGAGVAGYPTLAAGMLAGPALYSAPGQRMAATLLTQRPAGANALANQFRGNDRAKLAALMAAQAGNTGNSQFNFLSPE